MVRYYWISY